MAEPIIDACFDSPKDERNIQYLELLGGMETLPTSFFINDGQIQDQEKDGWRYGCVFYGTSSGSNLMNFLEGSDVRIKGSELCEIAVKEGVLDKDRGALFISGPKLATKLGYLDGYAEVPTIYEIKHSIANKRPVGAGSNQIDWFSATESNGWTVYGGQSYGHFIIFDGYDDKRGNNGQLRIRQSYDRWDKSHQWIDYDVAMNLLYKTRMSLIDKADPIITNYKKTIMENISIDSAKKAFENGFWNGLDPKNPASREEVAAMIQRAFEKIKN